MNWEMVGAIVAIVVALSTAAWVLLSVSATQFEKRLDERFATQDKAREEGRKESDERYRRFEENQRNLEHTFLNFKAQLPMEYVRREDHIRFETTINAKMDAIYSRLELISERQLKSQGAPA